MKDIKSTCDPCEENFKNKTNDLVKEGTAPSQSEHRKREQEVKSAYGSEPKNPMPGQYGDKPQTAGKQQYGEKVQKIGEKVKEYGEKAASKVGEKVQQFGEKTEQLGEKMVRNVSTTGSEIKETVKAGAENIRK